MEYVNCVFGNCLIEDRQKSPERRSRTQQEYTLNSVFFIKDFHWSSEQNKVIQNKIPDIVVNFNTNVRDLLNWGMRLEVDHSKQNTVLFGEQRGNIAYFLEVLYN